MEKKDQPSMISLFIKQCMLFRSRDKLFWFFGAFVWIDLGIMVYVLFRLLKFP